MYVAPPMRMVRGRWPVCYGSVLSIIITHTYVSTHTYVDTIHMYLHTSTGSTTSLTTHRISKRDRIGSVKST